MNFEQDIEEIKIQISFISLKLQAKTFKPPQPILPFFTFDFTFVLTFQAQAAEQQSFTHCCQQIIWAKVGD